MYIKKRKKRICAYVLRFLYSVFTQNKKRKLFAIKLHKSNIT
jgi:hypothetical protein